MGLLDAFFGTPALDTLTPEQKRYIAGQQIMGIASGLLKAAGPSRMPVGLLGAVGNAMDDGNSYGDRAMGLLGASQRQNLLKMQADKIKREADYDNEQNRYWSQQGGAGNATAPAAPTVADTGSDDLVSSVMQAESGGNPNAVSPKGATGLMQLMPKTAADPGFGVRPFDPSKPLTDPAENMRVGTDYLNAMRQRYGDDAAALVAYNAGPGTADKWIAGGRNMAALPAETQAYVQKIMGQRLAQANTGTMTDAAPGFTPQQQQMLRMQMPAAERMRLMAQFNRANQQQALEREKMNRTLTPEQMAQEIEKRKAGASNQNVTVAGEKKYEQDIGSLKAKAVGEWRTNAQAATDVLTRTAQLRDALDAGLRTGFGAETMAQIGTIAESLGVKPEVANRVFQSRDLTSYMANARGMVFSMLGGLGVAISNADREFIEKTLPNAANTADANRMVIDYIEQRAAKQIEKYEKGLKAPDPLLFEVEWNKQFGGQTSRAPQPAASPNTARADAVIRAAKEGAAQLQPTLDEIDAELKRRGLR